MWLPILRYLCQVRRYMLPHRIEEFMRRLGPDAVAIIPSAREATRSNDTHYRYRQDSDFYYLTGFDEPEAIAILSPSHKEHKYVLFVRPRDPEKEVWDGFRAGVEGAVKDYGADAAFPVEEFATKLSDLINGMKTLYYRLGAGNGNLDELIIKNIARLRSMGRRGMSAPQTIVDTGSILHEMRLIKADEEISIMQQSADIAAEAHREAMKTVRPGMKEYEIEALIEYIFRKNGAAAPSYNSIVGGGANATILHYIDNDAELRDGDLMLVDAGAEYRGYASDITRCFPVNGRFSKAQRDIYDLVLKTQMACIDMVKPGVSIDELHNRSVEILTEGMLELNLLQGDPKKIIEEGTYKRFYMHRLGHYLGMDVHDVGLYYIDGESRKLQPGMVTTIEPGLYVALDAENVPDQYRGIGVRIEDDVLVTPEGNAVLTKKAPKEIDEIEALMNR
jgi:Xaa-Pro aminopeptidase